LHKEAAQQKIYAPLLPKGSLFLRRAVLIEHKVKKLKDCSGPQKLDLLHGSLLCLKLNPSDSQGLFDFVIFTPFLTFSVYWLDVKVARCPLSSYQLTFAVM
jgi:hypothetical protein